MNPSNGPVAFLIIGSVVVSFFLVARINGKWESYLQRQRVNKHYGHPQEPEKKNPFPRAMGIAAALFVIGLFVLIASPSDGLIRYYSYVLCMAPLGFIVTSAFVYLGGLHEESKRKAIEDRLNKERQGGDR